MREPTRDPLGLRAEAPLFDAFLRFAAATLHPFTIPGHKHRRDLLGPLVDGDIPLYAGLDTMKLSSGVLDQAEELAARAWGADVARFSVGGSTHGNQALALTVGRPGDRVVVGRTLHRSMLLGLVLADLVPTWVTPSVDPRTGLPLAVSADVVAGALAAAPSAVAVLVTDPQYVGTYGDTGALAATAHRHGVPLVVDAAWAGHFGFHPDLPPHALAAGADALVISAHKALTALNQGAIVLARTERIDPARFAASVEATATTSPSGAVLASIDLARALLQTQGAELLGATLDAVVAARARLEQVEGLTVLQGPGVDPLKLVVGLSGAGADGVAVERDLVAAGHPVELADRDTVVAMVTLADRAQDVLGFADLLARTVERHRGAARPVTPQLVWTRQPEQVLTPREAFFARHAVVPAAQAVGRVCAELVAPYPPGIPVLAPGERVDEEVVAALRAARAAGTRIAYAADPTLATLRVVG